LTYNSLTVDGTLVTLAVPDQPLSLSAVSLLRNRRSIAGTLSGGLDDTQEYDRLLGCA
jgi:uncharacterized zinc-type alcohol dehydrogenase-like protein